MTTELIITSVVSLLGGGAVAQAIDWWGKHKAKRLESDGDESKAEASLRQARTVAEIKLQQAQKEAEIKIADDKAAAEIKREDTGRHYLEDGWKEERKSHKDCLERVVRIESEMFKQQHEHEREKEAYQSDIKRLTADNARLHRELSTMRDALLASFLGETDRARELLHSIPPAAPAARLVK